MPTRKVNAYPESKCLPGEYKRPEKEHPERSRIVPGSPSSRDAPTGPGVITKKYPFETSQATRKVNTYPESKYLPGDKRLPG